VPIITELSFGRSAGIIALAILCLPFILSPTAGQSNQVTIPLLAKKVTLYSAASSADATNDPYTPSPHVIYEFKIQLSILPQGTTTIGVRLNMQNGATGTQEAWPNNSKVQSESMVVNGTGRFSNFRILHHHTHAPLWPDRHIMLA
jgi:hypothetical protein